MSHVFIIKTNNNAFKLHIITNFTTQHMQKKHQIHGQSITFVLSKHPIQWKH